MRTYRVIMQDAHRRGRGMLLAAAGAPDRHARRHGVVHQGTLCRHDRFHQARRRRAHLTADRIRSLIIFALAEHADTVPTRRESTSVSWPVEDVELAPRRGAGVTYASSLDDHNLHGVTPTRGRHGGPCRLTCRDTRRSLRSCSVRRLRISKNPRTSGLRYGWGSGGRYFRWLHAVCRRSRRSPRVCCAVSGLVGPSNAKPSRASVVVGSRAGRRRPREEVDRLRKV